MKLYIMPAGWLIMLSLGFLALGLVFKYLTTSQSRFLKWPFLATLAALTMILAMLSYHATGLWF